MKLAVQATPTLGHHRAPRGAAKLVGHRPGAAESARGRGFGGCLWRWLEDMGTCGEKDGKTLESMGLENMVKIC